MESNTAVRDFSGYLPTLELGSGISIPTYFLVISFAFCLCVLWLVRRAKVEHLSRNTALDIALALMISGFIGARLFHVLFEAPSYYIEDPVRVFHVWQGGFVWYGGALAGAAGALAMIRYRKLSFGRWADLFAPLAALGYALGRVACFFTGCCFGDVCHIVPGHLFRYPTQLFAVAWELGVLALVLGVENRKRQRSAPQWFRPNGRIFALWLVLHSIGRIIMETFRADDRGPALAGLSVSTWISLGLIAATVGASHFSGMQRDGSSLRRRS